MSRNLRLCPETGLWRFVPLWGLTKVSWCSWRFAQVLAKIDKPAQSRTITEQNSGLIHDFFLYWPEWTMTFTLFFSVHVLDEEQVFPDVWWLYSWRVINRLVGKSPLSVDVGLCIRQRIRAAGGRGVGVVDARPCACSQSSDQISCWPSTNNRTKKLKPKDVTYTYHY